MLERLDAAVSAALQPLQAAVEAQAAEEAVRPLAQVSLSRGERSVVLVNCCVFAVRCCWRTPKTCWLTG